MEWADFKRSQDKKVENSLKQFGLFAAVRFSWHA
jgi:hypothetical protein